MSYTIDEHNAERQQLLAECLNPLTIEMLRRIPGAQITRVLDIGCGQGNTTRMLAECFPNATVTGLDFNPALVAHASGHAGNRPGISFEQGDAARLSAPAASFDLVFTRYLLLHVSDPAAVIREMLRVVRPGGFVAAYEPDCCVNFSYPPNPCMDMMTHLWKNVFTQPQIGRQLVPLFRAAGVTSLQAGAVLGMDHERGGYGRLYRLTAEAIGSAVVERNLMTPADYAVFLAGVRQLEEDPQSIIFKMPDVWVIAQP